MSQRLKKTPATPGEWNALGRYFFQNRVFNLAVGAFSTAVRARPENETFRRNLGVALLEMGDYRRALQHLNKALELNPGSSKSHYYLGLVFAKQRKFDKAREIYQKVLELKQDRHWEDLAREKLSLLELGMADDLEYLEYSIKKILEKRQ